MEMVPECADTIRMAHDSMGCWIALQDKWHSASPETKNRIMHYSRWCWNQAGAVATAVSCAFIEHVTEDETEWPLFRRWYDSDTIRGLMPLWKYNHGDDAEGFMNRLLGQNEKGRTTPRTLRRVPRRK
jgi:hypothetical protein